MQAGLAFESIRLTALMPALAAPLASARWGVLALALASACGSDAGGGGESCMPGTASKCTCPDMRPAIAMCQSNGKLGPCVCAVAGGQTTTPGVGAPAAAGTGVPPSSSAGVSGGSVGVGPIVPPPVGGATTVGQAGRSGFPPRSGAAGASFPMPPASAAGVSAPPPTAAGTPAPAPPPGGSTGAAAGAGAPVSNDQIEMARQVCVDEINRYRATLMVAPLTRGSAEQEMCSDTGAKKDGDSGKAHGSASDCRSIGLPGQQDTCPGWPVGGRGGNATLADALKKCLAQMWAEGEPAEGRQACIADRTGCFQMHGHYLNMSDPTPKVVACGFYQMMNGAWWMNQNFGR